MENPAYADHILWKEMVVFQIVQGFCLELLEQWTVSIPSWCFQVTVLFLNMLQPQWDDQQLKSWEKPRHGHIHLGCPGLRTADGGVRDWVRNLEGYPVGNVAMENPRVEMSLTDKSSIKIYI